MKQHFVSHHPSSNLPSEYPQIQHLYSQQKKRNSEQKVSINKNLANTQHGKQHTT